MSEAEEFSPELLRKKRIERGLSIKSLSQLTRLKPNTIYCYECGRNTPPEHVWYCLKRILNLKSSDIALMLKQGDTWITPSKEIDYKPVKFMFDVGRNYNIGQQRHGGVNAMEFDAGSGNFCVFRYEGKSGVHHKFTEVKGGWMRTYTDAQLIGKVIEEVSDEQA